MSRILYHWEDLAPGSVRELGRITPTTEDIKEFAEQFDPQPFHLDEQEASSGIFGGLVASGWHTAALTMRLLVEGEMEVAGGLVGAGVESIRWPRPVRPGDTLRVESEVLEVRQSQSRPDRGVVRVRSTTFNQVDQPVMEQVATLIVPRRPA